MRKNPQISEESHRFLAHQMFERAAVAGPFHVLTYLALSQTITQLQDRSWVLWVLGVMCFITVGRTLIWYFSKKLESTPSTRLTLRTAFAVFSLLLAAAWSGTTAKLLLDHGITTDALMVNIALFGICAIAIPSFAYDLAVLIGFLQVAIIPVVIGSYFATMDQGLIFPISYMFFDVFFCYIAIGMHRFNIQNMHQIEVIGAQKATVEALNLKMQTMVESLDEAFLLIGPDGRFLDNKSTRAEELFGSNPSQQTLAQTLSLAPDREREMWDWLNLAFSGKVDFQALADLGPSYFHRDKSIVQLRYRPMRDQSGDLQSIVMVAKDISREIVAERQAQENYERAEMVMQVLKDPAIFREFVLETKDLIKEMKSDREDLGSELPRKLHNLKGVAGLFHIGSLVSQIHEVESQVQVDPQQVFTMGTKIEVCFQSWIERESDLVNLILKDSTHTTATRSLKQYLLGYADSTQRTCERLGKMASLHVEVAEGVPPLPQKTPAPLKTFIHFFNNAVDHAIELPEVRVRKGKPAAGRISIHCETANLSNQAMVRILIADDGGGIDSARLRQSMLIKNPDIHLPNDHLSLCQRIFEDGVSSRTEVTELSGRGVGMSAIKSAVAECGGSVAVIKSDDQGTTFEILLPRKIFEERSTREAA